MGVGNPHCPDDPLLGSPAHCPVGGDGLDDRAVDAAVDDPVGLVMAALIHVEHGRNARRSGSPGCRARSTPRTPWAPEAARSRHLPPDVEGTVDGMATSACPVPSFQLLSRRERCSSVFPDSHRAGCGCRRRHERVPRRERAAGYTDDGAGTSSRRPQPLLPPPLPPRPPRHPLLPYPPLQGDQSVMRSAARRLGSLLRDGRTDPEKPPGAAGRQGGSPATPPMASTSSATMMSLVQGDET